MSKLTIKQIFSHFQFYQDNYQRIITSAELYYQPVESAVLHFSLVSQEQLYLGDVLQLWLNQTWLSHALFLEDKRLCLKGQSYIFAVTQGQSQTIASVWSPSNQQILSVHVDDVLSLYLPLIRLKRPQRVQEAFIEPVVWAKVS